MSILGEFIRGFNSVSNNRSELPSNDQGLPWEQYAAANGQQPGTQGSTSQSTTPIGEVPGYPETGAFSWRKANDPLFIAYARQFNEEHNLSPGDPRYRTPQFLKAWAMIETGGDREAFLKDPLQMNANPEDWDASKAKLGVPLNPGQMTPEISSYTGLRWLDMKGHQNSQGVPVHVYQGDLNALRRYNGKPDIHAEPNVALVPYDYHPGRSHSRWYASKIIDLSMRMLGYE
jgi:hypothetical protein